MRLEDIPMEKRLRLLPVLRAIRHDIGRYICFEQRFIEDRKDVSELRRALHSDVWCTRKNGEDVETCRALWLRLRPVELDGDPDYDVIDSAIEDIMRIDLGGPVEELYRACTLAETIRDASRRLLARGRSEIDNGSSKTTGEVECG